MDEKIAGAFYSKIRSCPYADKRRIFMAKDDRFEKVYSQGVLTTTEIWVDKETGVNYLFHAEGNAGGLTPLLDREGKPVISPKVN